MQKDTSPLSIKRHDVSALQERIFKDRVSIPEYAAAIGRAPRTVYAMIDKGLPAVRIGGSTYVVLSAAENWWLEQSPRVRRAAA